jgi:hypothetical protein
MKPRAQKHDRKAGQAMAYRQTLFSFFFVLSLFYTDSRYFSNMQELMILVHARGRTITCPKVSPQ